MTYSHTRKPGEFLTIDEHIARFQAGSPDTPERAAMTRAAILNGQIADLSALLRNVETCTAELRNVVDAGGDAVNMREVLDRVRQAESSLHSTVENAAKSAGLVAA